MVEYVAEPPIRAAWTADVPALARLHLGRAFYAAIGWPADGRVRDLTADGVTISEVRYAIRLGWRKPYLYLPRG
jgi:hypothetical protein